MTIMQGDSYPILINLVHDGDVPLTPDMVEDVELTVSNALFLRKSAGEIYHDPIENVWYFHPTQEQTLALDPGDHGLVARVKYLDAPRPVVVGIRFDDVLHVLKSHSREVL